jgi:hypothetical protein
MKKTLLTILLLAVAATLNVRAQKARKVLIIGIDGTLNAGLTQTWAPNIYALMNDGHSYVSTDAQTDIPTISGNGWSGIMTGVGISKHRQPNNSFQTNDDYANYPAFFHEIKAKYPTLRTVSIASWLPINKYMIKDADITKKNIDPGDALDDNTNPDYVSDEIITVEAIDELENNHPGVLFVHLDDVDAAGHGSGFSITNTNYTAAITAADLRVKRILDALKARPTYDQEDWLVAITTDHGGSGSAHGGATYQERNVFIILNNPAITPTVSKAPDPVTSTEPFLYFPGTGSAGVSGLPDFYAKLPEDIKTKINFGSESFTLQLKVRMLNWIGENYPPIISDKDWNSGANTGFALAWHNAALKLNFARPGSRNDFVTNINLGDKQWHYVTVVMNRTAGTFTAYENGTQKATAPIPVAADATTAFPIMLAADGDANYNFTLFKGNIAQVRIFKGALSATDVANTWSKESYASGETQYDNLVYYTTGTKFNNDKTGLLHEPVGATNGINQETQLLSATSKPLPSTMETPVIQQFLKNVSMPAVAYTGAKTGNKPNLYGELPRASTTDKIDFGTEDFTIQVRVKMNNAIGDLYPPIISNKDWSAGANAGFALAWHTQTLKFNFTTTSGTRGTDLDTEINLGDGRWHYVTIVVKRSNGRIYAFDGGVLKAIKDIAYMNGLNATTAFPINIAADGMAGETTTSYPSTYFNGNITHVRIFKGALSEKEIRGNWKNDNLDATAPEWSKLVFYNKGNVLNADQLVGTTVPGAANTNITLKTNGAGVIPTTLTAINAVTHDEETPPFSYAVPATVLRFLDVPIPANYDGEVLAGVTANPANSPLPVKLISFVGTPSQMGVNLKWTVATEDNVNHYEVQRKVGGGQFVKIGEVKATGTSIYNTVDINPFAGVNYYRLKVIDNNGASEIKDPIAIDFKLSTGIDILYPNPVVNDELNLNLIGRKLAEYSFKIVNTGGKTLQKGTILNQEGNHSAIKLDKSIPSGIYFLYLVNGNDKINFKFVKQ